MKTDTEATNSRLERMAKAWWEMHAELEEARGRPALARWENLPPDHRRQIRLCVAAAVAAVGPS